MNWVIFFFILYTPCNCLLTPVKKKELILTKLSKSILRKDSRKLTQGKQDWDIVVRLLKIKQKKEKDPVYNLINYEKQNMIRY